MGKDRARAADLAGSALSAAIGLAPVVTALSPAVHQDATDVSAVEPTAIVQTVEPGDTDVASWFTGVTIGDEAPNQDHDSAQDDTAEQVHLAADALDRQNRERMEEGLESLPEPEYADHSDPPPDVTEPLFEMDAGADAWGDPGSMDMGAPDAGPPGGMW